MTNSEALFHWFLRLAPVWQGVIGVVLVVALVLYVRCVLWAANWLIEFDRDLDRKSEVARREYLAFREAAEEQARLEIGRERADFYNRVWTKNQAILKLREYQRELKRPSGFWSLSEEEIQQRIDFLELGDFKKKMVQTEMVSEADMRITFRRHCDEEKAKELRSLPQGSVNEPLHAQRVREIENFWEDKKRKGPSKNWRAERTNYGTS